MPHIVISGPITPEDIWLAFEPTEFAEGENRFKAEQAYLASTRDLVLIRSLVVERGFRKTFHVRIAARDEGGISLGIDPLTRPDISDGVKRLLGLYAWKLLQIEPTAEIASTNIGDFVKEPA